MINLKQKLQNNEQTIGSWLTIANPIIAEIMSEHFDWLVVDMEHSSIDLSQTQNLIRVITMNNCVPLVRVSENNPTLIKRVLDAGACGIIVPMVNSKEDVQKALEASFYPPKGKRGVGLARAQNYGFKFERYNKWHENNLIVIGQIEHIDATLKINEILNTNIDGIIIGPYDLSASMNIPGNFENSVFQDTIKEIVKAAKEHKKSVGYHVIQPQSNLVEEKIKEGYNFIAFSLDTLFFGTKIRDEVNDIKICKT